MMPRNTKNILFVEGKADLRLIPELMEANGINWPEDRESVPAWIHAVGGFDKFWSDKVVETAVKSASIKAIGVIFDADEMSDNRWATAVHHCKSFAPGVPDRPTPGGWLGIVEGTGARFGLWMMPDNQRRGYMETFLCEIAGGDALWPYAVEVVAEAKKRGARFDPARHGDKARIHSWLAWQKEPGRQLHQAIKERVGFDPRADCALPFVEWFKHLFMS
jgi:hypothetical protein